jgi:hypothetical protein
MRCFLYLLFSLLALSGVFAAEPRLRFSQTFVRDAKDPGKDISAIRIGLVDAGGHELNHLIRSDSPAATEAKRFKLLEGGDSKKILEIQIFKKQSQAKFSDLQSEIILLPPKLDESKEYTLEMTQGAGELPGIELKGFPAIAKFGPVRIEKAGRNAEFLSRNKAVQTNASIFGGKDGASASVKLTYGLDSFSKPGASTDRFWRFQSLLDADLSYNPKKTRDYINSINGEADFVLAQYFKAPSLGGMRGLFKTGIAGRFESDQLFGRVNLTVGWTNWLSLNSPGLDKFSTSLCMLGKPEAAVPPILIFSYDYVSPVKNDLASSDQGVQAGHNRLRGRFYWSLAIAHNANLLIVHNYDADLLIDIGAVYDFDSGKTLPDVRLSFEIGPAAKETSASMAPRFTLSYVNGRTTPTFRNFNALLAGFKLAF